MNITSKLERKDFMKKGKKLLSFIMAVGLAVTCLAGCGGKSGGDKEITFCVIGEEPKDASVVMEKVNEKLDERLGINLKLQFVNTTNYDLLFSSGEDFDLVYIADWLQFWENAEKGAFMELTDEDLKEFAPDIYRDGQQYINTAVYNGKRFAIPAIFEQSPDRCYLVRGDLMNKYGIDGINSIDDFERYLDAIAKNEPDLIPYDENGANAFHTAVMMVNDQGWLSPGTVSCASPVFFNVDDPEKKLFIALEQEQMKEFTRRMKRWNDNGYFSKSALSNTITSVDSFKNGRSAAAFSSGPQEVNTIYKEFQKDERKNWDIRAYPICQKMQPAYGQLNMGTALSANTKNKEMALKVMNELFANEEIYDLMHYGIEGVHYNKLGEGLKEDLEIDSFYEFGTGIANQKYIRKNELAFPNAQDVTAKLKSVYRYEPLVNMRKDLTNIREISAALDNIYNKYTAPRMLGFVDDPEKAMAEELDALKKAGIDTYIDDLQKQMDEYIKTLK